MPCDETLDERITRIVKGWKNTAAKKMFGGICHLLNGNLKRNAYLPQSTRSAQRRERLSKRVFLSLSSVISVVKNLRKKA